MTTEAFAGGDFGPKRRAGRKVPSKIVLTWGVMTGLLLAASIGSATAYAGGVPGHLVAAGEPATTSATAPVTTTPVTTTPATTATTAATTVPPTAATTVPATTATTSVTTTTEPSSTTTTASTTSTTTRRVIVGIAATRGLVVTEQTSNAQSGWIAFGILLVVVLGLAVVWWVHERRKTAGGTDKPAA